MKNKLMLIGLTALSLGLQASTETATPKTATPDTSVKGSRFDAIKAKISANRAKFTALSTPKKIGVGVAATLAASGLTYLGYKSISGKTEKAPVAKVAKEHSPNMFSIFEKNNGQSVRTGMFGEIDPVIVAPKVEAPTKFEQVKAFVQNMGKTAKSYTWDMQVGGHDVGMYSTLAVAVAALGYGIYKLAPIVKNAIVGQIADTQPVKKHVRTVRHSSTRTMRRPA